MTTDADKGAGRCDLDPGMEALEEIPAGVELVLTVPVLLTSKQRESIDEAIERSLPGRRVLVLDGGMKLGRLGDQEQLARIESKLDALIEALAPDHPFERT